MPTSSGSSEPSGDLTSKVFNGLLTVFVEGFEAQLRATRAFRRKRTRTILRQLFLQRLSRTPAKAEAEFQKYAMAQLQRRVALLGRALRGLRGGAAGGDSKWAT